MTISSDLLERAEAVIPNSMYGHQLVKLLPDGYPQFFERAKGATLWDADGNAYLDYMCAYGPNLFGYGTAAIDDAYIAQLRLGDTMTGPSPLIVGLAEALVRQVGHADWAIFCKNGTDATTMAASIARSHTRRKTILIAAGAYHGSAPWCTPIKTGTTSEDRANQIHYVYNDVASLEEAVRKAGNDLAAIFAAPLKHDVFTDQQLPDPAYARRARELCDEHDALLIVDDVRAGFRITRDCSWATIGVEPDLSSWGKAIANGHPISALLGSNRAKAAAASIYATGSFWFSAAPMAAALATLNLIRTTDYLEHTIALGEHLRTGLDEAASRHGFGLRQTGPAQLPLILFDDDAAFAKSYFWCATLLRRGIYFHPWHNMFICNAMTVKDIDYTIEMADAAFGEMKAQSSLPPVEKLRILATLDT